MERGELRRKCGECECEDLIPRPLHSAFVHLHSAKLRHLCVKRQIRHFSSLHRSLSAETLHPLARPHSAHTEVYRCVYAATKTIPTSVQGELLYMCLKIETDTYQRMCSHSGSEEEDISVHSNQITSVDTYQTLRDFICRTVDAWLQTGTDPVTSHTQIGLII